MLAQEFHKPVIKKFNKKEKFMRDLNIWAVDLTEMESLFSKNQGVKYLCVLDVFTKYAWFKPLKDKIAKIALYVFIEIVNK